MGAAMGRETDAVAFFAELADATYRYDFYQTLRRIECLYATKPRWGEALLPSEEPVRLGQDPDLSFAPAPLASFEASAGKTPRLQVRLFGLLGPNGPLPLHITEYVRERLRNADDPTLSRFLDMLQHRFIALFYRAWAQAQPHIGRDRPDADLFAGYISALIGVMPAGFRYRDSVADVAKLFHGSALVRHVRNAEGLATVLRHFFRVPTRVEEFVPHWMSLGRARANGTGAGRCEPWRRERCSAVASGIVSTNSAFTPDRSPSSSTESFLPARPNPRGEDDRHAGTLLRQLVDWVRLYLSFELEWDVRLTLAMDEIPPLTLGVSGRLGWTTWLAHRHRSTDASDLYLNAETLIGTEQRVGVSA